MSQCMGRYVVWGFFFFFLKQKPAYGVRLSLVGWEMCMRDRLGRVVMNVLLCSRVDALGLWAAAGCDAWVSVFTKANWKFVHRGRLM